MFFSMQEEKVMGNLFEDIAMTPYKEYIITFFDGSILRVQHDTCYESDNGLEVNDENYLEYMACAMRIIKVIIDKTVEKKYKEQMLIEINYMNYPQKIVDSDGKNR